jgi:hypothetical protein
VKSPSPSALNFLAGILAGAGINLLTSLAGGTEGPTVVFVLDSSCWIAAAASITWAAHLVDGATRTADLYITSEMNKDQQDEIRTAELRKIARPLRRSWLLTLLCLLAAFLLLPGLVSWHQVACRVAGERVGHCGAPSPPAPSPKCAAEPVIC